MAVEDSVAEVTETEDVTQEPESKPEASEASVNIVEGSSETKIEKEEKVEESTETTATETKSENNVMETNTEADEAAKINTSDTTNKTTLNGDDLTRIEGIGPKINSALIAYGIDSYLKLKDSDEETIRKALSEGGVKFAPSVSTWAKQAEYLVKGDEEGFKEYTDYLVAGRDPGKSD